MVLVLEVIVVPFPLVAAEVLEHGPCLTVAWAKSTLSKSPFTVSFMLTDRPIAGIASEPCACVSVRIVTSTEMQIGST